MVRYQWKLNPSKFKYYRIAGHFRGIHFSQLLRMTVEPRKLNPRNKTNACAIRTGCGHNRWLHDRNCATSHQFVVERPLRWEHLSYTASRRLAIQRSFLARNRYAVYIRLRSTFGVVGGARANGHLWKLHREIFADWPLDHSKISGYTVYSMCSWLSVIYSLCVIISVQVLLFPFQIQQITWRSGHTSCQSNHRKGTDDITDLQFCSG